MSFVEEICLNIKNPCCIELLNFFDVFCCHGTYYGGQQISLRKQIVYSLPVLSHLLVVVQESYIV